MEGLLPLVYRAVKKSRTRREYQRLRSVSSPLINMAEIYPRGSESHLYQFQRPDSTQTVSELYSASNNHPHHRRHNSVGDFTSGGRFSSSQRHATSAAPKPLVRFSSHRRMFSCITA
ncbi:uncharacterized protein LOC129310052 [Prosopis cineraria]|uniref:uncharacterized protein LOC129310052 n=1 Tax=Prosopis cineraria TaxID=364024 RepID=UPI00240EEC16|nr:uncharacterized protein LOC129310052 [Prosopis cineraria]